MDPVHFLPNEVKLSTTQCHQISPLDRNRGTTVVSLNNTSYLRFGKEAFSASKVPQCSFLLPHASINATDELLFAPKPHENCICHKLFRSALLVF